MKKAEILKRLEADPSAEFAIKFDRQNPRVTLVRGLKYRSAGWWEYTHVCNPWRHQPSGEQKVPQATWAAIASIDGVINSRDIELPQDAYRKRDEFKQRNAQYASNKAAMFVAHRDLTELGFKAQLMGTRVVIKDAVQLARLVKLARKGLDHGR